MDYIIYKSSLAQAYPRQHRPCIYDEYGSRCDEGNICSKPSRQLTILPDRTYPIPVSHSLHCTAFAEDAYRLTLLAYPKGQGETQFHLKNSKTECSKFATL